MYDGKRSVRIWDMDAGILDFGKDPATYMASSNHALVGIDVAIGTDRSRNEEETNEKKTKR